MIEVKVKFKKCLYGNEDSDFLVYSAESANNRERRKVKENKYGNFTISGDFFIPEEDFGKTYTVTIEEDYDSKYPSSYKMLKLHFEFPEDPIEQWEFLEGSNVVPVTVYKEIKKAFSPKDKILDIMIEEPERLKEVKGIGENRIEKYKQKLLEAKDKALLFMEYGNIDGVGSKLIGKLYYWKPSVEDVIKKIKEDPFAILEDLDVGFVVADKFRDFYKFPLNDKNRILHGVSYYLKESFQSTGNTYDDILSVCKEIAMKLKVGYQEVVVLLASIKDDDTQLHKYRLKIFGKNITTIDLFKAESLIFASFNEMKNDNSKILSTEQWEKNKKAYLESLPQSLSEEQEGFLSAINNNKAQVLLGPGGAGKSWVINIACDLIKKAGKTFGLFAPTARAAKVMKDYVEGGDAKTIHRGLLKYVLANETAPFDFFIVDEFSMVDSELAAVILRAMGPNTRLIIVGDDYQLQSVGPGNVLFDLVNYIKVPTVRLTKIFRQKEEGGILDYAQDLREGTFELPVHLPRLEDNNIVFINENSDERKQEIAMKLYSDAYSASQNNHEEILLLTPMNKSSSGRRSLNKKVQEIVNPSSGGNEISFGTEGNKKYYRRGDYITVTSNVYDMVDDLGKENQIINGDLGEITQTTPKTMTFDIEGKSYTISKSDITGLIDHAWAITIHKSQGGQANDVIVVLPEKSYFMLNSNMLYTALTRAKLKCYIIGDFAQINKAAKTQANYRRRTLIQLQVEGMN